MRLVARRIAAIVAVVLGLACVSAAAIGSDAPLVGPPPAPKESAPAKAIPPFDPESGGAKRANQAGIKPPSSFDSEFGDRGEHEVVVSVTGSANYFVGWRDKEVKQGVGSVYQRRTITGGFPLAQVALQAVGGNSTCTITIDGDVKDRQSTSEDEPLVFCEG